MKNSLWIAAVAVAALPGCILPGMYSYTATVKFTEIVKLPVWKVHINNHHIFYIEIKNEKAAA